MVLADRLAFAPAELAAQVREDLTGAGVDPAALRCPPVIIWAGPAGRMIAPRTVTAAATPSRPNGAG